MNEPVGNRLRDIVELHHLQQTGSAHQWHDGKRSQTAKESTAPEGTAPQHHGWAQNHPIQVPGFQHLVALVLGGRKVGGLFTINADGREVNDATYAKLLAGPKQHVCSSRMGSGSTFARAVLECPRAIHDSIDIAQMSRPVGGIGACHVDDDAAGA